MEDTMTLSTSASSARTLHRSLVELAQQREHQNSSNGNVDCVHCSGSGTMSATTSTSNPTSAGVAGATSNSNTHLLGHSESHSQCYSASYMHQSSTTSTSALVLPSPPDSPNLSPIHSSMHSPFLDSVSESSLPSVSSSFFFSSSAAGSPGRSRGASYPASYAQSEHGSQPHLVQGHESSHRRIAGHNLIIPSLTLPSALRPPTPFGQTLGELRLLVLGAQGAGKSFLTGLLLEDNEDVVEVGTWEDWEEGSSIGGTFDDAGYGKVLRASTDYAEQKDAFGLERYEPTRNVHIVELPGYSQDADGTELITRLERIIETPFRALNDVLHPEIAPSGIIASLLASPTSPLYTAMVFLLPSPPTTLDGQIIAALSTRIPLVVLPRLNGPMRDLGSGSAAPKLSDFRPASAVSLRNGLFHSPETVSLLRSEAADRFLRWREVERSVDRILGGGAKKDAEREVGEGLRKRRLGEREWGRASGKFDVGEGDAGQETVRPSMRWSKARWEAEWMDTHSQDVDVARKLREATVTKATSKKVVGALKGNLVRDGAPRPEDQQQEPEYAEDDGYHSEKEDDIDSHRDPLSRSYYDSSHAAFDPLHFPSLIIFTFSLFGPLKVRVGESIRGLVAALGETRVRVALLGGVCVGVGVGFLIR